MDETRTTGGLPAGPAAAERSAPRGPDAPAVVLGLAVLTTVVLVALTRLTDVRVDVGLVVPLGLLVLGALLVAGGVWTGLRRRDRHPR